MTSAGEMRRDPFAVAGPEVRETSGNRAPVWPLLIGAACAVGAIALLLLGDHLPEAASGYVLGCLVVPLFVVVFRTLKRSVSSSPLYLPRHTLDHAATLLLGVGLIAGAANAWFLATELAKR